MLHVSISCPYEHEWVWYPRHGSAEGRMSNIRTDPISMSTKFTVWRTHRRGLGRSESRHRNSHMMHMSCNTRPRKRRDITFPRLRYHHLQGDGTCLVVGRRSGNHPGRSSRGRMTSMSDNGTASLSRPFVSGYWRGESGEREGQQQRSGKSTRIPAAHGHANSATAVFALRA